jgi:tetratricopeptide (TPR) repeat protein
VAIEHFAASLGVDSTNYAANWGMALALIQLGSDYPQDGKSAPRDALYARAEQFARRGVAADSGDVEGWFVLANAMGRASLTRSNRERVRRAAEIREAARRAVALDPRHAGAWHVLGRWHAEVMRLSGVQRFFARSFLGGRVLGEASWDSAIAYLERAVELDPDRVVHRVALAGVYADRGRYTEARAQIEALTALPDVDYGDDRERRAASELLVRLEGRTDRRRQPRYRSRAESMPSSMRSRNSRRRRRSSRRVRRDASPTRARASSPISRARRAS